VLFTARLHLKDAHKQAYSWILFTAMATCSQVWIDTYSSSHWEEDGIRQKIIGLYRSSRK